MSAQFGPFPQAGYAEVVPPPAPRPFVQRFWVHRIEGPPPPEGRRLLPDGRLNLVWVAGRGVQIAGPQTTYGRHPDAPSILAIGATFHAGAAPSVLRDSAAAFVDEHVPLDTVDAKLAARLDDRLGHVRDGREAAVALSGELGRALRAAREPDDAVATAVRMLDDERTTIADVATSVFLSERQLERRFADHIGYGPKVLQRVLRFQRFLKHLEVPRLELAGAAALAGYADQSHLSRETRRLAGLTPRQLIGFRH